MNSIERDVLEVCREMVLRQQEMLPQLATTLQVPADQVFYTWAFRKCKQRGRLEETGWVYFFHGLECDLTNAADGRFLRIDFGPHGRVDTFTAWGVLQFLMTSAAPWLEFPQLKSYFAKGDPPFNKFSGDFEKLVQVWDRLQGKGTFEKADPSLVELEAKHTSRGADGLWYIQLPPGTSEETSVDCKVAGRLRLSPYALQLLAMPPTSACPT